VTNLPSIRPLGARTKLTGRSNGILTPHIPVPLSAYVVDCAVYAKGHRLPGRWTHERAVQEVRNRDDAFVWIGLHEPDGEQIKGIAETFGGDYFPLDAERGLDVNLKCRSRQQRGVHFHTFSFRSYRHTRLLRSRHLHTSLLIQPARSRGFLRSAPCCVLTALSAVLNGKLSCSIGFSLSRL